MTQIDLSALDDLDVSGSCDPQVGSFLDDAWHSVKSVIKSPVTKAIAGGVAVVFPPVGVPATAALVVADRVVRASESKDPKVKAKAAAQIKATTALANKGDAHAQAAMKTLVVAKNLQGAVNKDPGALARAAAAAAASAAGAKAAAAAKPKTVAKTPPAGWTRSAEGSYRRAS